MTISNDNMLFKKWLLNVGGQYSTNNGFLKNTTNCLSNGDLTLEIFRN